MLTEEEKEILHIAGKILYRECSSREGCKEYPPNIYNACHSFDIHDSFAIIGKALQEI